MKIEAQLSLLMVCIAMVMATTKACTWKKVGDFLIGLFGSHKFVCTAVEDG